MQKNVELEISGIKCDNPSCDYSDMAVPLEDYPIYVGKPCPLCNENLLTQESYDKILAWVDAVELANSYTPEELANIVSSMTSEEIDIALDNINSINSI